MFPHTVVARALLVMRETSSITALLPNLSQLQSAHCRYIANFKCIELGKMEFRLFYEGPFVAQQRDDDPKIKDRRRDAKHRIRRAFHFQLKELWRTRRALNSLYTSGGVFRRQEDRFHSLAIGQASHLSTDRMLLAEYLPLYFNEIQGFRWVPLVCQAFDLTCKLDILLMRRDAPGQIFHNTPDSRDIDNRLKVLFDALRKPKSVNEIADISPQDEENPFYVLLEDDSLITNVSVETDDLLSVPKEHEADASYARVLVKIKIAPHSADTFNLSFA